MHRMLLVGGVIGILIVFIVLPDEAFLHTLQCDIDQSITDANQDEKPQAICFLSPNDVAGKQ